MLKLLLSCILSVVLGFGLSYAVVPKVVLASQVKEYEAPSINRSDEPASGPYAKILVLSDTQGVDFGPYLSIVLDTVRKNWYGLIAAAKKTGVAEIDLIILSDGNIDRVKLTSSSGDSGFDQTALNAIKASVPFEPLPGAYQGSRLALKFTLQNKP